MHAREDIDGGSHTFIDYYKEYVEEDGVIGRILLLQIATVYLDTFHGYRSKVSFR